MCVDRFSEVTSNRVVRMTVKVGVGVGHISRVLLSNLILWSYSIFLWGLERMLPD